MHDVYRGKDCIKEFCECLREQESSRNHIKMQKSVVFVKKNKYGKDKKFIN